MKKPSLLYLMILLLQVIYPSNPAFAKGKSSGGVNLDQLQVKKKPIENRYIDAKKYIEESSASMSLREERRITEEQFIKMAKQKNTIILDTRSLRKFKKLHVKGARHLNFSDITEKSLRKVIPSKNTRVLIYCNNNFEDEPEAFPTKAVSAPLNIPTFQTLYSYGYRNIYELGPVVDPKSSKLEFEGTMKKRQKQSKK